MPRPAPFAGLDPAAFRLPAGETSRLLSPALVIRLDAVRANLWRMLELTGSPGRWRPHVKTTKTPAVFAECARAGLRHFKCATVREARCLLETLRELGAGPVDLLVAYPHVGPALPELGRLAREHGTARLSVLCETPELVREVPAALSMFVDVDPGMGRTGVPLDERERILALARVAGTRFRGLHFYEGHLRGEPELQRRQTFESYERLLALVAWLSRAGVELEELVTSGTPAFRHALSFPGFADLGTTVHRVSPGTVVFHDLRSEEEDPTLGLRPAALVFTRVVSRPRADVVTCDAGSKSISADAGDPCACVLGHPGLEPLHPSEEHLPLRVFSGPAPERGSELYLVPRHVCTTVNLFEQALLVESGTLRAVVPVAARAH
jgi:D-serine deaminase-like pyridoxal phosphate-dependent protein